MTTKALVLAIGLGAFLVAGPAYAGVDPGNACKESKAKGSGKKAFDLLKAFGKNIKKHNTAKLSADISKAESKFTKFFSKAESKGGCLTSGDSGSIEARINLHVCQIVDSVGPATCGNNCAGVGEECDGTDASSCVTGLCIPAGDPNECTCQGCGDGILIGGEECDDGAANGTSASCCNIDCTLRAASEPCDDTDGNVCTTAGCDGLLGACDQNHIFAPSSDPCPDTDGNVCTTAGCDGAGVCDQGHIPAPASDPCPDTDGNVCTTAGCDGAGVCDQSHIFEPDSTVCPDTDGNDCTTAGCDGAGVCDQAHVLVPASTPCTTAPDLVCANPGCDGAGVCDSLHFLEPASVECRASAGVCDPAENCTGSSADCPADGKSIAECRASAGVCDPAESCDGVNDDCPANGKSTAECRASAGVCDPAESCDGVNDDCPADGKSTAECRASAGVCDPAESCDGVGNDCPADGKSTAECRPVAGDCDVAESCDGVGNDCPADGFVPGSNPCTDIDGNVCTIAGCDGAGNCDQGHVLMPASNPCPDTDGNDCTVPGCDGLGVCDQGHVLVGDSTPCTDTDANECTVAGCNAGVCDQQHVFEPDDTLCGGGVAACSTEHCDGAGTCVNESRCCAGLDCSGGSCDFLSFETGIPSGTSGWLRNFRCSNASSSACIDSAECDFGTCLIGPNFCWNGSTAGPPCTNDGDCQGTCAEVVAGNLPLALERGGLYTGGGLNSVPLPFPVPDKGLSYTSVTDCNSTTGELTLGPTTPADLEGVAPGCTDEATDPECHRHCTQGRTCTGGTNDGLHCVLAGDCPGGTCTDNCIFGPPLPIPNSGTPATSVCTVNVIDLDAIGTAECDGGDSDLTQPLRSLIYLNGDLFKSSTPPDIPGVQPCPLCDYLCVGGTKVNFPCDDDSECPGSACATSPKCLGGPNSGGACTPATSDSAALGDSEDAYPTSHDCGNDLLNSITDNIGGLPINFALTTGTTEVDAVDRTNGNRNFCGFCRDVTGESSLCFEGDARPTCPNGSDPNCQPLSGLGDISGCGNAVQCFGDGDCSAPYESCVQRDPGAFSEAASTKITVTGATDGGCLGDNALHPTELVAFFCIPPTFDTTVDAAGDLPGPGTALLAGDAQLD